MPDPEKIVATVRRSAALFRATPGRSGGVVTLSPETADEVIVVGDLHGNVPAFRHLLEVTSLGSHSRRHLVLQELIHGPRMYVGENAGDRSHQLVDLVAALKCQYPERVHLILGNHELSELTGRPIAKNGTALNALFRLGLDTAYGSHAGEVYAAYLALFAALPLAVRTPNRVFVCHTIPDGGELDATDPEVFKLDTWPPEAMRRHGSVYNLTWGRDTAPATIDRFASMVDADWFITGHQPCDDGFRQANHRQIIIDGTDPYPAYCLFPVNQPVSLESLLKGVHILPVAKG
jgi:Calcineurin-like phosphoesterase